MAHHTLKEFIYENTDNDKVRCCFCSNPLQQCGAYTIKKDSLICQRCNELGRKPKFTIKITDSHKILYLPIPKQETNQNNVNITTIEGPEILIPGMITDQPPEPTNNTEPDTETIEDTKKKEPEQDEDQNKEPDETDE